MKIRSSLLGFACLILACQVSTAAQARWWKGNLHTHSLWSDGNDYPEMIAAWYKENGYNFLCLSDHNRMLEGEAWVPEKGRGSLTLQAYLARFGTNWVERQTRDGQPMVRLKTLQEFRGRFEERGRFIMIPGEEISDHFKSAPIHLNASNTRELIKPQGGNSVLEVMQNNVNAVMEQRERTGQPMIPHINHPNFGWAISAEDLMRVEREQFFEVYNGHPGVRNYGSTNRAGTDRIWDIVLTRRLAELNLPVMWGTAVDDAHQYEKFRVGAANPGRGWIMVRAPRLTPEALIEAMEKGDFYATTGVLIDDIRRGKQLSFKIKGQPGVTYKTQFIGTRKGYDGSSKPVIDNGKELATTRIYSDDIGTVLAETEGLSPAYKLKGDEIYVRARIVSSKPKQNPFQEGDFETAWVQPLVTGVK